VIGLYAAIYALLFARRSALANPVA